jgi:hypothetical protein
MSGASPQNCFDIRVVTWTTEDGRTMAARSSVTWKHCSVRFKVTLEVNRRVRMDAHKRQCCVCGHCPSAQTQLVPLSLLCLPSLLLTRSLPPPHPHRCKPSLLPSVRPSVRPSVPPTLAPLLPRADVVCCLRRRVASASARTLEK